MGVGRMTTRESGQDWNRTSLALFAGIGGLVAVDVIVDLSEGTSVTHVAVEGIVLLLAAFGVLRLLNASRKLAGRARVLERDLASSREEAERWRREASDVIAGLGVAVERQFARWALTKAESEVALLLLKGLSLKEVALARAVSERTARDQARGVYRKAGLSGRADLAAFFLEDLLLPDGAPPSRNGRP
jgi:DNA-binding CsgD family transcriptional regulator/uncharacterized membrane protein YidH (DUF202 family)